MKIIDAQIHIWSKGTPSGVHRKVSSYTAEQALKDMDEAGVDAALIHPPSSWDADANALAVAAAEKYPARFAVLGQFALDVPENRKLIHGWNKQPGMLGLRWALLTDEQRQWLRDGKLEWLWPAAEREGLPIATMAGLFLPEFRRVAEAHPHLKLIVDHCGIQRYGKDENAFDRIDELLALAKLPNVALKATGAPGYARQPYPFRDIQDGLHRMFDAFGPQRFFWGTDITRMPCSWRKCVTFFTEELKWLKGRDLELVMGRAVCDWIGWKYKFD